MYGEGVQTGSHKEKFILQGKGDCLLKPSQP